MPLPQKDLPPITFQLIISKEYYNTQSLQVVYLFFLDDGFQMVRKPWFSNPTMNFQIINFGCFPLADNAESELSINLICFKTVFCFFVQQHTQACA